MRICRAGKTDCFLKAQTVITTLLHGISAVNMYSQIQVVGHSDKQIAKKKKQNKTKQSWTTRRMSIIQVPVCIVYVPEKSQDTSFHANISFFVERSVESFC